MPDPATDYVTVFFNGSFLPVANGGSARLADLLDRLQQEFERVILYSYADHPSFPWRPDTESAFRARWPGIELVLEDQGTWLPYVTRLKNLVAAWASPDLAARIMALAIPGATPRFSAVKRRSGAILVSYTEGLTQVNGLAPTFCIVETHDLNFLKWSKMQGGRPVSVTALRKLRIEMTLLEACRAVVAIAPGEAAFFRMMLARPAVALVPSWGMPAKGVDRPKAAPLYDLVFAGSAYVMNVRGLCELLDRDGDWLRGYRLAVCGGVCDDPAVRDIAKRHGNVELLGYVPDLATIYASSRAALSPVDGTGVKMKILGALDAGLPVFATPQSAAGLPPGGEGAVFPLTAKAVEHLLSCEDRIAQAGASARRYSAALCAGSEAGTIIDAIRALVPTNLKPGQSAPAG